MHSQSKLSATAIFPLSSEKLKKIMTHEAKKAHPYPPVSILVAPKKLVVTICERQTCADVEREFTMRHKELQSSRGSVSKGSTVIPSKQEFYSMGASASVVIQELIQLVRSLIESSGGANQAFR